MDHLSAYSLIVEDGTRLAARVRRDELPAPDDDVAADRYRLIDTMASAAGLQWYEVSNWALPGSECRHNLGYWSDADWWGAGPGAHGHLDGRRWWNLKHPATYARAVDQGEAPIAGEETVDAQGRALERIMLGMRTRQGIAREGLPAEIVTELTDEQLIEVVGDHVVLTSSGRLLADAVVRRLAP